VGSRDYARGMESVPCVELPRASEAPLSAACSAQIREALEAFGFVRIANHGIDDRWIEEAYGAFARFFVLPLDAKRAAEIGVGGQRGFTRFGVEHAKGYPVADLKEFFHVGQPASNEGAGSPAYPPNVWPADVQELEAVALRLFRALEGCARRLLCALAESYGLPGDRFGGLVDGGNSILRAVHYPWVRSPPDGALRAAPHEDINLITLLCGATQPGLEIESRGAWVPVVHTPGELVVDTGDMLSRLTNGVLPATPHRVVALREDEGSGQARFALPFFAHARPECDLTAGAPFVSAERPLEDTPITAGEYLAERLREIGLAD